MRKKEFVYRELLFQALEKKRFEFTQKGLSSCLNISLSNVNHALKPLRRMNALQVHPRNLKLVNVKKILYYWASVRDLEKNVIYETRVEMPVREIEKEMPEDVIFTGYSGYKFKFRDVPADYSEVYVYAADLQEIKRRFPVRKKQPNLFVLQKDEVMESYGKTATIGQIFVDLWNLPQWYAKDFLKELEARIDAVLE